MHRSLLAWLRGDPRRLASNLPVPQMPDDWEPPSTAVFDAVGGYSAGSKPVSQFKPPPASICVRLRWDDSDIVDDPRLDDAED